MQDSGQGARHLEAQATALLAALPAEERDDILLPDQIQRRKRREQAIPDPADSDLPFLAPVLALREGGASVPGDREQVFAEFEICERVLDAAGLLDMERAAFLLHTQYGLSDQAIAFIIQRHRVTVTRYRQQAEAKVRRAVSGLSEQVA